MSPSAERHRVSTFRIGLRSGVWTVTKDQVFYGDYHSQDQALKSACSGARAIEAKGGLARVLAPGETPVPYAEHDARPAWRPS